MRPINVKMTSQNTGAVLMNFDENGEIEDLLAEGLLRYGGTVSGNTINCKIKGHPVTVTFTEKVIQLHTQKISNVFRDKFKEYAKTHAITYECGDLKKGDIIQFRNGYGFLMESEILGFDEDGRVHPLWDCYWVSIDIKERQVKKLY